MIRFLMLAILASFVPAILVDDDAETPTQLSERVRLLEKRLKILEAKLIEVTDPYRVGPSLVDATESPAKLSEQQVKLLEKRFEILDSKLVRLAPRLPSTTVGQETGMLNHLVINMRGELAREYTRRTASNPDQEFPPGLEVSIVAVIDRVLDDGKLRFEHSYFVRKSGEPNHLVTLSGTIDAPRFRTTQTSTLAIDRPDLKGLKLRKWTMTDEAGEE